MDEFLYWLCSWLFTDNFYSFLTFLITLGTFIVALLALQIWKRKTRFEYASRIFYLLTEISAKIKCYDYESADRRGNELKEYFESIKLIYPKVEKDVLDFIRILDGIIRRNKTNNLAEVFDKVLQPFINEQREKEQELEKSKENILKEIYPDIKVMIKK